MNNRITPLINLITGDSQYAYKNGKSTIGILAMVNDQIKNANTRHLILLDFQKAFGKIERDIVWWALRVWPTCEIY